MKDSMKFITRLLMLCAALSATGGLSAHSNTLHPPKKNRYYYYPRQNIYYDPVAHVYFVWERTHWKSVPDLPGKYVSANYSGTPRFEFWISGTHPYYYNVQHRRTYYAYRFAKPARTPYARAHTHAESRAKPNVSFQLEINPVVVHPEPIYVKEHVVIVKDRGHKRHHGHGHRHHPGRGKGHGHR